MLSSVLNLLVHGGLWRFSFEDGTYDSAQHNPWSTWIATEHNKSST